MNYTPDNIIENIDKIGPWSLYGLAEIAICYFYPEYEELVEAKYRTNSAAVMAKLCNDWHGIVVKYQTEVGYKPFKKGYVNEF